MKKISRMILAGAVALVVLGLLSSGSPPLSASAPEAGSNPPCSPLTRSATGAGSQSIENPPPFDFSDAFYRINGIIPENILMRAGNPDRNPLHWAVDDSNTDPNRRNIRILETTGGFDADGNLIYYSIMGVANEFTFASDAAGVKARNLAETFRAFLFPKTPRGPDNQIGNVILDPAPPNRRQDNIFETKTTYFCENQLGLWQVDFVIYTKEAFLKKNQATMNALRQKNGSDLDGTPRIRRQAEIEDLLAKGLVELRVNPPSGGQGPRWVI